MNPVEPTTDGLRDAWRRLVYAAHQPEYIPLPTLGETRDALDNQTVDAVKRAANYVLAQQGNSVEVELLARWVLHHTRQRTGVDRVVSVWEPDQAELLRLLEWARSYDGHRERPRVSLMLHTFGEPLQPIKLIVGEFDDPYHRPAMPHEHGRERAYDASGRFEDLNAEITGESRPPK